MNPTFWRQAGAASITEQQPNKPAGQMKVFDLSKISRQQLLSTAQKHNAAHGIGQPVEEAMQGILEAVHLPESEVEAYPLTIGGAPHWNECSRAWKSLSRSTPAPKPPPQPYSSLAPPSLPEPERRKPGRPPLGLRKPSPPPPEAQAAPTPAAAAQSALPPKISQAPAPAAPLATAQALAPEPDAFFSTLRTWLDYEEAFKVVPLSPGAPPLQLKTLLAKVGLGTPSCLPLLLRLLPSRLQPAH
ncbi:hypothetical protein V8C86DRAFT_908923 [Haematococcus lacustris]